MVNLKKLTLEEFIYYIHEYEPNIIYNEKDTKMFYFVGWGDYGDDGCLDFKTKNSYIEFTKYSYTKEDFLEKINIVLRKDKILKLRSK